MSATNADNPSSPSSERKTHLAEARIGAVSYLNSKPLIEGLSGTNAGNFRLDYPSRLAESLAAGRIDVGLIPSIETVRAAGDYEIVSDACIAAHGPVRSVKVYFRVPPGSVTTLALDEGSRSSAALARVMLAHKYGVTPRTISLPLGRHLADTSADAILLIGDRAMRPAEESFETEWDLGEEWRHWTGLPFVFAAWAARRGAVADEVAEILAEARDHGVENVEKIVDREARLLELDRPIVHEYLTRNLHFTLGPAERSGLKLFAELAADLDLAPRGNHLVFHERPDRDAADRRHDESVPKQLRRYLVGSR